MPPFRVGKPRLVLGVGNSLAVPSGVQSIAWPAVLDAEGWEHVPPAADITIPKTGVYLLVLNVARFSATTNSASDARIVINGSVAARGNSHVSSTGQQYVNLAYVQLLELGAVVRADVQGATGVGQSATLGASTRFALMRVGPERWT